MANTLGPCTLLGRHVRLEPIRESHAKGLLEAGRGVNWAWMPTQLSTSESMSKFISDALRAQDKREVFAFTVMMNRSEGRIVGNTRYLDVRPQHRGVEIGWTWYSPNVWGTVVNPECKFLLLKHAFEDWRAIRVQLKCDSNNLHSRRAILKLGAKFEGTLRSQMIRPDGTFRDSMVYSITSEEWPSVKEKLQTRIEILAQSDSF